MRKSDNPFEPGAGIRPPELVGREIVLEDAEAAIARGSKQRPIRGQVYYGLRGVGKTVLLRIVCDIVERNDGLIVYLEAPEKRPLERTLAPALRQALVRLSTAEKARRRRKGRRRSPSIRLALQDQDRQCRGRRRETERSRRQRRF